MRVDVASQVLSASVSKVLKLTGGLVSEETAMFALTLDKFFDCLNVTNFTNGTRSDQDVRLKNEFLPYLDQWEHAVQERHGFTKTRMMLMLLSHETGLGLRVIATSFVEFIKYLSCLPDVKEIRLALFSKRISQVPLKNDFGCPRQRGGTSDNPTVSNYFSKTDALRVVDLFGCNEVKGNCRGVKMTRNC
uniref:Uncharacterized protein n=1 Tax=Amphimedon queenslandica TaxID=400682 RepID=A0A1X7U3S6_AMPQE